MLPDNKTCNTAGVYSYIGISKLSVNVLPVNASTRIGCNIFTKKYSCFSIYQMHCCVRSEDVIMVHAFPEIIFVVQFVSK